LENNKDGPFTKIPFVVLINNGTASAAEIIVSAIQAQNRAILIGNNTYGKDKIQLVFDLSDGSSLHVTAARWWPPNLGYNIQEKGVIPDVKLTEEEVNQPNIYQTAASYLSH